MIVGARAVTLGVRLAGLVAAALLGLGYPVSGQEPQSCGVGFTRLGSEVGVSFRHDTGARGEKHYPETMGSGVAWIDYDGDGWLDLYAVQSGPFPPNGGRGASNRLYRSLGGARFEDVTARSRAHDRGYGQGALAADLDGDGNVDLHVANYGPDVYLRNRGDGTFEDATEESGLGLDGWSIVAAAADAEGDGDLDLYVVRYLRYDTSITCTERRTGLPRYCGPELFLGEGDRFFLNRGDGTFEDATERAGFGSAEGKGMGVAFVDLDGDRLPEVYVSNDLTFNLLFHNLGGGRFQDLSLLSGAAVNAEGQLEAGMGVAVGDVDRDGDPDVAVTNWDVETNTLYRNLGGLAFEDVSAESGFGPPSFNRVGFGLAFVDVDRDGALDFYAGNGHVREEIRRDNVTRAQPDLLLLGDGKGHFVASSCPGITDVSKVTRGLAVADYDNDGDPDLAVQHSGDSLELLRHGGSAGRWIGIGLRGAGGNTEGLGAVLRLASGASEAAAFVRAGHSYESTADTRVLFATGQDLPVAVEVQWPTGERQRYLQPSADRYLRVFSPSKLSGAADR